MNKQVIIYHDNCPDGWGSAWWLGKHLGEHVKHAGRYGEPPPLNLCRGAHVWIVDFCYPAAELTALADVVETLTIFDHHQTSVAYLADAKIVPMPMLAYCELEGLGGLDRVAAVLDMDHSGVGLVSAYVRYRYGKVAPTFLANIEDRDLWRFALPNTKNVFAAVTSHPYTERAWDDLADIDDEWHRHADGVVGLAEEGRAINRYRDQLIDQVAASTFLIALGGWNIPCVSAPYAIGSDVAGELVKRNPDLIGAYCILHDDHVQLGLRSTDDGPDVAAIAESYGGGGHRHASGLRLTYNEFANSRLMATS